MKHIEEIAVIGAGTATTIGTWLASASTLITCAVGLATLAYMLDRWLYWRKHRDADRMAKRQVNDPEK